MHNLNTHSIMTASDRSPHALLILSFLVVINTVAAADDCAPIRCGGGSRVGDGPVIRFPFRHKSRHPQHCGYANDPGFDLECNKRNETVFQLVSEKLKFVVNEIDYVSQRIRLENPQGICKVEELRDLNLSHSNFRFWKEKNYPSEDYMVLNCSARESRDSVVQTCRNDSSSSTVIKIDVISERYFQTLSYISCTKLYTVPSLPSDLNTIDFNMKWSEPAACGRCESHQGRICNKSSELQQLMCDNHPIPIHHPYKYEMKRRLVTSGEVLGPILVVAILFSLYSLYLWNTANKEHQAKIEMFLQDYKSHKPTRFSYADLKKITNDFQEKLGEGRYGIVYKGKISSDMYIAAKLLNNSIGNGEEFITEVGIMGRIHHVNVVRLLGYCADGFNRALIYEFLPNDTLERSIFQDLFRPKKIYDIALGIAKGIEYLHLGCEMQILHFDIKPNNILLDHNFNPKICDFGLAKLCSREQSAVSMTFARGTMGYIAPEVMSRTFGRASYKSDVYSFGMVLLKMVGQNKNAENDSMEDENAREIYDKLQREDGVEDEDGDEETILVRKLSIIGLWCIQWYPTRRPSTKEVLKMLEGDVCGLAMPPNPFQTTNATNSTKGMFRRQHGMELDLIEE